MKSISLSLNPTYHCNLRCDFCYLSKEQLSDPSIISIDSLFSILNKISAETTISHVDIYGGEISFIPTEKALEIIDTVRMFYQGKINLVTNFIDVKEFFYRDDVTISVSWDSKARAKHELVYENMRNFKRPFSILMLASDKLLQFKQNEILSIIDALNLIPNLISLEIKPYSQSKYNRHINDYVAYENWVQQWIDLAELMKFKFINIQKIISSHKGLTSSWSDDHLYIQPDGSLSVLDFSDDGKEYFLKMDTLADYHTWALKEKKVFNQDHYCGECKYNGRCLSEHLQKFSDRKNSCSGFFNLLENNQKLVTTYD